MITTITLGAITLNCDNVLKPHSPKIVKVNIPERDGAIFQNMGLDSKEINLTGIITGAIKDTNKTTLEGYKGTTQTYNDGVDNITVLVQNVYIPTTGGQPNHYNFDIQLVEYNQT